MTFTLIHDRGGVRVIAQPKEKFDDPTISKPRDVQRSRPRGTWKGWREVKMPSAHNGYKPGLCYDLGVDQCRFIPGEDHVMCGAKQRDGSSYCETHYQITKKQKIDGDRK
jgi:hypothetical protein